MAKANKHAVRAKLSDYTDHQWGEVRNQLMDKSDCPQALKAKGAELHKAGLLPDFDPFA